MTTVINTPSNGETTGGGFVIGIVFVVVTLFGLFFVYGMPAMRNRNTNAQPKSIDVNVKLPTPTTQP